jgi:proline iminopeptidase
MAVLGLSCSSEEPSEPPREAAPVRADQSNDAGQAERSVDAAVSTEEAGPTASVEDLPSILDGSPCDCGSRDDADTKTGPRLFPKSRPYRTGRLAVSKLHTLYFELVGKAEGTPVIVLHGGPGGMSGRFTRSFFDPERFKTLLFDQRGAGRSQPRAEHRENTTQLLIDDINALRDHLGFEEPAILFGGSWGSTLAVAYAEAHPDKVAGLVLGGVFLCSKAEIDHFYHGGTAPFYPKNFAALQEAIPNPERHDYPAQLFAMITSGDPARRRGAINAWARYEIRMTRMTMTDELAEQIVSRSNFDAFSTLENHYMMNGCFLEEGQLLRDADRIKSTPTSIVNGRHDAICPPKTALALAQRLEQVKLEIVPFAAHSGRDDPLAEARLRGLDWVAKRVEAKRGR